MTVIEAKEILLSAELSQIEHNALKFLLLEIDSCCGSFPNKIWRDISGYEGDYQISNFGRVKSFKRGKVKILKPAFNGNYFFVYLHKNGNAKMHYIHILVAKAFIPNPENKPEVNHINGDKTNCCVENLAWATSSENREHAVEMGFLKSGCENGNAKLSAEQVHEIRRNCIPGDNELGFKVFAKKFNVIYETISDAYHRITYKDVD